MVVFRARARVECTRAANHARTVVGAPSRALLPQDCRAELHALLQEERLMGATLLVLANKQDIPCALSVDEVEQVRARVLWCVRGWVGGAGLAAPAPPRVGRAVARTTADDTMQLCVNCR
jgi:hypothetical protein